MKMVSAEEQERIMREQEEVRAEAEAHGCGYMDIPIQEIPGGGMISKRIYVPVRPLPCVRDEHGEIAEQTVKRLMAKIDEELNELKEVIYYNVCGDDILYDLKDDEIREIVAEEAADTITAITTLCYYCGIDEKMRSEAQMKVNSKNRDRGRL